jgi:hypothetical protein
MAIASIVTASAHTLPSNPTDAAIDRILQMQNLNKLLSSQILTYRLINQSYTIAPRAIFLKIML